MEIDENKIGYQAAEAKEYWESKTGQPYGAGSEPLTPVVIYSLSFDAEELLAIYGGMTTYLKVLCQQESQDFETIKRVGTMLIQIKPRAVEASKSLALKAVG